MAVITTTDYFQGELEIANKSDAAVTAFLQMLINKYEADFLKLMFPYGFALDDNIKNGVDYTNIFTNIPSHWIGFSNDSKQSPIANYIYVQYLKEQSQQVTGTGGVKTSTSQNAIEASPWLKICSRWNEMVEWNLDLIGYMLSNNMLYPTFYNFYHQTRMYKKNKLLSKMNPIC